MASLSRQNTNLEEKIVIDRSKADLIKDEEQFIHGLFKVWVVLDNSNNKSNFNEQQLTLFGSEKNLQDAKEYLLALCKPEYTETIDGNLFGVLNNPQLLQNLIIQHKVAIKPGVDSEVIISGRSLNVVLAKASIEREEIQYQENLFNGIRKDSGSSENVDYNDDDKDSEDEDDDPYAYMHDTVKKVAKNESKIYTLKSGDNQESRESEKSNRVIEKNSRATFANFNHQNILEHYETSPINEKLVEKNKKNKEKQKPVKGTFTSLDNIFKENDVQPKQQVKFLETHQSRDDSRGSKPQIRHKSVNSSRKTDLSITPITSNSDNLRPIFIDGSNVAREHGKVHGNTYSCVGIEQVVNYFLQRGHKTVEVFVPRFRRGNSDKLVPTTNPEILDKLERHGILKYTPSASYDDRFVIQAAIHHDGIIVSNDQYRDLHKENPTWGNEIPKRLLQYVFSGDLFIPAVDPLGRRGPKLEDFLTFEPKQKVQNNLSNVNVATNRANRSPIPDANKSTNQRDIMFTTALYTKLQGAFQGHDSKITKLLNEYPNERDYNFFARMLQTYNQSKKDKNEKRRNGNDSKDKRKSDLSKAELFNKLDRAFSGRTQLILKLLETYPDKNDYGFFANMIRNNGDEKNALKNDQTKEQNKDKPEIGLYKRLSMMFPDQQQKIKQLLQQYRSQTDFNFFVNILENQTSSINNENVTKRNRNNNDNEIQKRDSDSTTVLFKQLNKMFQNQQQSILKLLEQYPNQKDFNFFANILQNLGRSVINENITQTSLILPEQDRKNTENAKHRTNHYINSAENIAAASNFEVKSKRDNASSTDLFKRLNQIFPNQQSKILELLEQYPYETEFQFFFNMLKSIDTSKTNVTSKVQEKPKKRNSFNDDTNKRDNDLTSVLFSQLIKIFPNRQSNILELFEQYPNETQFTFFFNALKNTSK